MGKTMKYVIIKDGIPVEAVEANDINEAMDAAIFITNGVFDDVALVGSPEYNKAVQARGAKTSEEMNQSIRNSREAVMQQEGGVLNYLAPYSTKQIIETGD